MRSRGHPSHRNEAMLPTWDWSFDQDGSLALDRQELWPEPRPRPRLAVSRAPAPVERLKEETGPATVRPMRARPSRKARLEQQRRVQAHRRARRLAGAIVLGAVLLVTLLLTAFGSSDKRTVSAAAPAPAQRLLPTGPPSPQVIALQGSLRIQLPVPQERLTAIGVYGTGDAALPLRPLGTKGNQGFITRTFHRIFGGGEGHGPRYYSLGGSSPGNTRLDVGAAAGTDVYAPVDGTVVGLTPYVINGRTRWSAGRHPAARRAVRRCVGHSNPTRAGARGRRLALRRDIPNRDGRRPRRDRGAGTGPVHHGRRQSRDDCGLSRGHSVDPLRILFLADVFGPPGRRAVEDRLSGLKEELDIDFCVVNGENAADGAGLTPKIADKLLDAGADVVTLGNHVWRRMEIGPYLAGSKQVIRPANLSRNAPGSGLTVRPSADGTPVAVLNLLGWLFLTPATNPFEVVDELVEEARGRAAIVVLDFHAEATSEKVAMARFLDGRVTAVVGTHTHIQTNDARVQPGGTAAITDAGMTGPHDSVIGVDAGIAIERMRTGMSIRFRPAEGDVRIEGVLVECDAHGTARSCESVRVAVEDL